MDTTLWALALTAISISFIHTASGPDHYLPFIVLSESKKWNKTKTILLTIACGLGHVLSSLIIGAIGVFLGWQLKKLDVFQGIRGDISSLSLFFLGLGYTVYEIIKILRNKPHKHFDVLGKDVYVYEHNHSQPVMPQDRIKVTPLVLFMIFVMGPSEPLPPLLFYSGVNRSVTEIAVLVSSFTITTVLTMLGMVLIGKYGYTTFLSSPVIEKYMGLISGIVITICGAGMLFLGW